MRKKSQGNALGRKKLMKSLVRFGAWLVKLKGLCYLLYIHN